MSTDGERNRMARKSIEENACEEIEMKSKSGDVKQNSFYHNKRVKVGFLGLYGSNSKPDEHHCPRCKELVVYLTQKHTIQAGPEAVQKIPFQSHNPFIVLASSNLNVFKFPVGTAQDALKVP